MDAVSVKAKGSKGNYSTANLELGPLRFRNVLILTNLP